MKLAFLGLERQCNRRVNSKGITQAYLTKVKFIIFALAVDGIEEEFERLKSAGVSFVEENILTLPNGARYLFFYGPDKEWIEYYEVKR